MIKIIYNFVVIILSIMWLPKALYEMLRFGKYRNSFYKRLGFDSGIYNLNAKGPVIWVHAVSVGEVRALSAILTHIYKENPNLTFVMSTITETGQNEAKKRLPFVHFFCYMPIDLSFISKRIINHIRPHAVIVCETDFWFNFLTEAKSSGAKVVLVNGKISDTSCRNFKWFSIFSKKLFNSFDLLCLQNEEYKKKFILLEIEKKKIFVTGNLKFDVEVPRLSSSQKDEWEDLIFYKNRFVLTIGSTHEGEESKLLDVLDPLFKEFKNLFVVLVPRHPERFDSVADLLRKRNVPFTRWSEKEKSIEGAKILLLDTMGQLMSAYEVSKLAIVGGSFVEGVGGHNMCEPANYSVPAIFGPFTYNQNELVHYILDYNAGYQVSMDHLRERIKRFILDEDLRMLLGKNGAQLSNDMKGSSLRTKDLLESFEVIPTSGF